MSGACGASAVRRVELVLRVEVNVVEAHVKVRRSLRIRRESLEPRPVAHRPREVLGDGCQRGESGQLAVGHVVAEHGDALSDECETEETLALETTAELQRRRHHRFLELYTSSKGTQHVWGFGLPFTNKIIGASVLLCWPISSKERDVETIRIQYTNTTGQNNVERISYVLYNKVIQSTIKYP